MAQLNPGSSLLAKSSPGSASRKKDEEKIQKTAIPEGAGSVGTASRELLEQPIERPVAPGSQKVVAVRPGVQGPSNLPSGTAKAQSQGEQGGLAPSAYQSNVQSSVEALSKAVAPRAQTPYDAEISRRKDKGETLSTSRKLAGAIRKRDEFLSGERVINNPSGDTGRVNKIYGPKIPGQERAIIDVPGLGGSISFEGSSPEEFYSFVTGEEIPGVTVDLTGRVGTPTQVQAQQGQVKAANPQQTQQVLGAQTSVSAPVGLRSNAGQLPTASEVGGRSIVDPTGRPYGDVVPGAFDASEQEVNAATGPLSERISRDPLEFLLRTLADPSGGLSGLGTRIGKTVENLRSGGRSFQDRILESFRPRRSSGNLS